MEVVPSVRRRVPASHQSQIRVQHQGATFSSHVDFGPADHAHDEHGNIIPLSELSTPVPLNLPQPAPSAGTKNPRGFVPQADPSRSAQRPGNAAAPLYQESPIQGANGETFIVKRI